MVQTKAAALALIYLTGCEISCKDMPVQNRVLVLPVRVEVDHTDEIEACQKDAQFWKEMATYYRDNACVYGQEGF